MSNLSIYCCKILMFLFVILTFFYSCTADQDLFFETVGQNTTEKPNTVDDKSTETASSDSTTPNEPDTTTVANKPLTTPVALATPSSGASPLKVTFTVNNALVSKTFVKYEWKFKDGTKASSSTTERTFKKAGKHEVVLMATNEDGQVLTDSIAVTVTESENEAPIAVATANIVSGEAPLQVDFSGSNSSDDFGITNYVWDFPEDASSDQNTTYTFIEPGVYEILLTVTDEGGLQDTSALTVTVTEGAPPITGDVQIPCSTGGGRADETGAKIWCWNSISVPQGGPGNKDFSDGQLVVGSECSPHQVTREGNRLKFHVNPTTPEASSWCNNDFNMRAEIRTSPWNVDHSIGTEEWFGWSYTFGDDYIIDREIPWAFFQVHEATTGQSPLISLWSIKDGGSGSGNAGEIHIVNATGSSNSYNPTGIIPRAGDIVDIVIHVIWGDAGNGLLQVWMNGIKVHDGQERTVRASNPVGGNAKFGIYKWKWRNADGIQKSLQQGITHLETYMGPLRMITRKPGDADYGKDSYNRVAPE